MPGQAETGGLVRASGGMHRSGRERGGGGRGLVRWVCGFRSKLALVGPPSRCSIMPVCSSCSRFSLASPCSFCILEEEGKSNVEYCAQVIGELRRGKIRLPEDVYQRVGAYLCPDWLEDAWHEEHLLQATIMLVPRGYRANFSSFWALYRCEQGHSLAVCNGVDPRRFECRMPLFDYFLTFLVPRYLGGVDAQKNEE